MKITTARTANKRSILHYNKPNQCDYMRQEVIDLLPQWIAISDCLAGEVAVKSKTTEYLPRPNSTDTSIENLARYTDYITRAVFYNATYQTFAGLMGQVFTVPPLIEVPEKLNIIVENVDGSFIDLTQLAKICVGNVLPFGRAGVLTDYSVISDNEVPTQSDIMDGKARSILKYYEPWKIINWRYQTDDNGKRTLSLVVLEEDYIVKDQGFAFETSVQYRELRIIDGELNVQIWRKVSDNVFEPSGFIKPLDGKGKPFKEITFAFIGAENNTADVDKPPMYDIASLNLAHYRNSADYEESVFIVGQPTPWVSGLDEQWVNNVFKGGFQLGSRTAIPLPKNATAGLLSATENGLVKEAMEHKERQMVAFGAKLVEQRSVQRTATEAGLEASAENSTLVSVVRNVQQAIIQCLKWACMFENIEPKDLKFELNTDFAISKMPTEEINSIIKSWQSGAISWDEMRINLRKGNVPLDEDKKAKQAIDLEKEQDHKRQIELKSNIPAIEN